MKDLVHTQFGKRGSERLHVVKVNRYAHLQVGKFWFTVSLSVADYYGRLPTTMAAGHGDAIWSPQVNITLPLR